ncbi:MAG: AgmX/PglI C-terminal domain-containing protein [Polyangiaceae bacterium]
MSEEEYEIPGKSSGTGLYIAGIVILGAGIVGLLYWRFGRAEQPPQIVSAPPTASTTAAPPPPQFAPPPPPKIETEPEPTATATAAAGTGAQAGVAASGPNPCAKCGQGEGSSALSSAISSAAAGARGCYNRALQKGDQATGKMNVSVQVGSTGAVCSAAITSDTVGSPAVSSCVLSRFQGRSFPPPAKGCVVVNVPINFTIKQ